MCGSASDCDETCDQWSALPGLHVRVPVHDARSQRRPKEPRCDCSDLVRCNLRDLRDSRDLRPARGSACASPAARAAGWRAKNKLLGALSRCSTRSRRSATSVSCPAATITEPLSTTRLIFKQCVDKSAEALRGRSVDSAGTSGTRVWCPRSPASCRSLRGQDADRAISQRPGRSPLPACVTLLWSS